MSILKREHIQGRKFRVLRNDAGGYNNGVLLEPGDIIVAAKIEDSAEGPLVFYYTNAGTTQCVFARDLELVDDNPAIICTCTQHQINWGGCVCGAFEQEQAGKEA